MNNKNDKQVTFTTLVKNVVVFKHILDSIHQIALDLDLVGYKYYSILSVDYMIQNDQFNLLYDKLVNKHAKRPYRELIYSEESLDILCRCEHTCGFLKVVYDREPQYFYDFTYGLDALCKYGLLDTIISIEQEQQNKENRKVMKATTGAMDGAAGNGHLDVVKWIYNNRTEGCTYESFENAGKNGHIEVFEWLRQHYPSECREFYQNSSVVRGVLNSLMEIDNSEAFLYILQGERSSESSNENSNSESIFNSIYTTNLLEVQSVGITRLLLENQRFKSVLETVDQQNKFIIQLFLGSKNNECSQWLWQNYRDLLAYNDNSLTGAIMSRDPKLIEYVLEFFNEVGNVGIELSPTIAWKDLIYSVAAANNFDIFIRFMKSFSTIAKDIHTTNYALDVAVAKVNLELVKWILENTPVNFKFKGHAFQTDSIEILKLLLDHRETPRFDQSDGDGFGYHLAATFGDLEKMKLFDARNFRPGLGQDTCGAVVDAGHLEVLKYLYVEHPNFIPSTPNTRMIDVASMSGHLHIIRWLHESFPAGQYTCNGRAMDEAARFNYLDVVKYLHETGLVKRCTVAAANQAAIKGHHEVLDYLLTNRKEGFTWEAYNHYFLWASVLRRLHKAKPYLGFPLEMMDKAASIGNIDVVTYLHSHTKCQCTTEAIDGAASHGFLKVVEYLLNNRTEGFTIGAIENAKAKGYQHVVDVLLSREDLLR